MTATLDDLFCQLDSLNIRVFVIENNLRISNASSLTDDLRVALKVHKQQIIREFTMPIIDLTLLIFGGSEIDLKGRSIKQKRPKKILTDGGLIEMTV